MLLNRKISPLPIWLFAIGLSANVFSVEPKGYRLLSITESAKLILVSEIPSKTKYMLDASAAKITLDGKPIEFKDLRNYTLATIVFDMQKGTKEGIEIDGIAKEIKILPPEGPK